MAKSEKQKKHLEKLNKNQKGKNNRNWKGGVIVNGEGYIMLRQPYHPRANKYGYVFEHILVMEKVLGRFLIDNEVIHHINGIKEDNKIENLHLFNNHSEHMKFHRGEQNRAL